MTPFPPSARYYQGELITLEELRGRIGELRKKTNAAKAHLETLTAHLQDEETYLRICESLANFFARLFERTQALSIEERQKVLRLIPKLSDSRL